MNLGRIAAVFATALLLSSNSLRVAAQDAVPDKKKIKKAPKNYSQFFDQADAVPDKKEIKKRRKIPPNGSTKPRSAAGILISIISTRRSCRLRSRSG